MKTGDFKLACGVVLVIVLGVATSGCEDNNLLAPKGGSIVLTANPSTVVLNACVPIRDPQTNELIGTTSIFGTVLDAEGRPQENIAVFFTTTAGRLGSAVPPNSPPQPLTTDPNGIVRDTLTVRESDPVDDNDQITVSASSSSVSADVTVTRNLSASNTPPVAVAPGEQTGAPNTDILLEGSGSDAETPTSDLVFEWSCGNGTPLQRSRTAVCRYTARTSPYTATLTVTDTGNGVRDPVTGVFQCAASGQDTVEVNIN